VSHSVSLRTAAWYGDREVSLDFPDPWEITVRRPATPPEISDDDIRAALERPVGQPPIRELARGCSRPLIVVDDLARPTPAARVMPHVLRHLSDSGIPSDAVTVLLATGTHGAPPRGAFAKKIGDVAASSCRLVVHDDTGNAVRLGRTSFGSPVLVDPEAVRADLLIGIGGIYPQTTVGFGGGSKLVLGILARRSIVSLHYGHPGVGGSYVTQNSFRRDLAEMCRIVGIDTIVSVHVDEERRVVGVVAGDHYTYYPEAVDLVRARLSAPPPEDADVVVSNAYPMDVSLVFMRSKGMSPFRFSARAATRILVGSAPEGSGHHGLYPFTERSRFQRQIHRGRRLTVPGGRRLVVRRAIGRLRGNGGSDEAGRRAGPVWVYAPPPRLASLPTDIPGMRVVDSWAEVLDAVRREQGDRMSLRVAVYPCAPLQVIDSAKEPLGSTARTWEVGE
jgi:nickel-dependent lactate racemase